MAASRSTADTNDLARAISHFDEPAVLALVKQRYEANQIYTSINAMMLAINPYADLGLYAAPVVALYGQFGDGPPPPPHVFGVAADAFKGMLAGGSQSILVAGESGAGKTESCRRVLQYLAHVGSQHGDADGAGSAAAASSTLHDELTRTNCVLEAFGNARTVMNDNSSRFGKFLVLQYGASSRLSGAAVSTYLLEKTRVVRHAAAERSFHVFYAVRHATPPVSALSSSAPARPAASRRTPPHPVPHPSPLTAFPLLFPRPASSCARALAAPSGRSSSCATPTATRTPPSPRRTRSRARSRSARRASRRRRRRATAVRSPRSLRRSRTSALSASSSGARGGALRLSPTSATCASTATTPPRCVEVAVAVAVAVAVVEEVEARRAARGGRCRRRRRCWASTLPGCTAPS